MVVTVLSLLALKIPIFGLINSVTIGLVSLVMGMTNGILLVAVSTVVVSVALAMFPANAVDQTFSLAVGIAFWMGPLLALWVLCGVLRYFRSLRAAMLTAVGIGFTAVAVFRLFVSNTVQWWQSSPYSDFFNKAVENVMSQQKVIQQQNLELVSAYLIGLLAAGFTLSIVINLFLARGWQAVTYNPGGFRDEFFQLKLGKQVAIAALALAVLLMLVGTHAYIGFVGMVLLVLLTMIYILYGIAVASAIFSTKRWHWAWLVGIVFLLAVAGQLVIGSAEVALVLVLQLFAITGFIDTFADFRKRAKGQSKA